MAVNFEFLSLLLRHRRPDGEPILLCSLGYPDIYLNRDEVSDLREGFNVHAFTPRPDSETIRKWHGIPDDFEIFDATLLLMDLGYILDVLDFKRHRGNEIVVDLNYPIQSDLASKYDVVLDSGTLEHLFFVAQGFLNVFRVLRPGGIYIHAAPISRLNHGFWSFNPTFYADFCQVNDVQIIEAFVFQSRGNGFQRYRVPWRERVNQMPAGSAIIVVFRKGCNYKENIPIQSKYL